MRQRVAWALISPALAGGGLAGHSLAYRFVAPNADSSDQSMGSPVPGSWGAESRGWLLVPHYRSLRICPNLSLVNTRRGDDARARGSSGRWSPGHTERLGRKEARLPEYAGMSLEQIPYEQCLPMPKRTVVLRCPTLNTSGTQAEGARR